MKSLKKDVLIEQEQIENTLLEKEILKLNNRDKNKFSSDFYTYFEFQKFISVVDDVYWKLLFSVFYYYGLRIGELRALRKNVAKMKTILKAYRFRLYPNQNQIEYFQKTFGCCRFIYNQMLTVFE